MEGETSDENEKNVTSEADKEDSSEKSEGNETVTVPEKKEKKKKKILVEKEKKKSHKRTLFVSSYYVSNIQPYSDEIMSESKDKLRDLARKDKERKMLEE